MTERFHSYKGGKAVFRARTFVGLFNEDIWFNDYDVCLQQGLNRNFNTQDLLQKKTISVIPNPANEEVSIVLHDAYDGICNIIINDAYGKIVIRDQFNCSGKNHLLKVAHLSPGIYTVYVNTNGKNELFEKLVIIR